MFNLKNRVAFTLINLGIRLLPERCKTVCFINNCISTGKIKLGDNNDIT